MKGFYWHCHHDELCEWVYDKKERVDYIKNNKPEHESKTRLKLFKKVKGKLPKEYMEALKAWDRARKKAWEAREKNWGAREKNWEDAWEAWEDAWEKYKPQVEKLHAKECGCKEWNGKEIVFGKVDK